MPEVLTEFFEAERYVVSVSAMHFCRHFADKLGSMVWDKVAPRIQGPDRLVY